MGKAFIELSAVGAYGVWVILFLFPLILACVVSLVDQSRSTESLELASIAIGIISASYMLRFYLVRNTVSLRSRVLEADNRENAIRIISGGFWWWLLTLGCAIAAVVSSRGLF